MMITAMLALAAQSAFDNGRLLPIANGQWTFSADVAGSTARFADQFLIRCDRATRRVTLNRLLPGASRSTMQIATDTQTETFAGPVATLLASDAMLDAIAYTRGRLVVTVSGVGSIALPFEPEVARSIEDCRN